MARDTATQHEKRVFTYDEWVGLAPEVEKPEVKAEALGYSSHSPKDKYDDFNSSSWKEALELAVEGWGQTVTDVERAAMKVANEIFTERWATKKTRKPHYHGQRVNVPRYLGGDPNHMIRTVKTKVSRHGRAVRLVVPCSCNWTIRTETFQRRGAAIMALVQSLITAKHPLEVWAQVGIRGFSYRGGGNVRLTYATLVQPANAPLNMSRIMYATSHESMLRRLGFAHMEQEPREIQELVGVGGGYGMPTGAEEADLPVWKDSGNSIILPQLESNSDWSEDGTKAWVDKMLDQILG